MDKSSDNFYYNKNVRFITEMNARLNVRRYLIALILCGIFFLYPFQVYVIGSDIGIGIEGAVYRYQISSYGTSLITITSDIMFVVKGMYSGKTAVSILFWVLGTIFLTATTIFGLIYASSSRQDFEQWLTRGLLSTCCCYLISCIIQYGILLSGPAGNSLPVGTIFMIIWVIILNYMHVNFFTKSNNSY